MGLDAEDGREIDEMVASLVPDPGGDVAAEASDAVAKQREELKRKLMDQHTKFVRKKIKSKGHRPSG